MHTYCITMCVHLGTHVCTVCTIATTAYGIKAHLFSGFHHTWYLVCVRGGCFDFFFLIIIMILLGVSTKNKC